MVPVLASRPRGLLRVCVACFQGGLRVCVALLRHTGEAKHKGGGKDRQEKYIESIWNFNLFPPELRTISIWNRAEFSMFIIPQWQYFSRLRII